MHSSVFWLSFLIFSLFLWRFGSQIEKMGNVHRDIRTNTQKFVDRIEAEIRKDPAHWLWMHNRWRPPHGSK